jgi:mRNA interferase HigB
LRVFSKRALREFWAKHRDAEGPLESWYKTSTKASWSNLAEVRLTYPHADPVGNRTVFNIKGNEYRLVVKIEYRFRAVYVKRIMTHAEYSGKEWLDVCNC